MEHTAPRTVTAPRPPDSPPASRFPLVATLAPLVVSGVLYAVTRSVFTLAFAALGPVVAIASLVDARLTRARTNRRESARFSRELAATVSAVEAAHDSERADRHARLPAAVALGESADLVTSRWRGDGRGRLELRIGCATLRSELVLEGASGPAGVGATSDSDFERSARRLREQASRLDRAPVSVGVETGIGISGSPVACAAVARTLALQLAAALSPALWSVAAGRVVSPASTPGSGDWIDCLPHNRLPEADDDTIAFSCGSMIFRVVTARSSSALAPDLDARLEVLPDGTAVIDGERTTLDLVGEEQAFVVARSLAAIAAESRLHEGRPLELAAVVAFDEIDSVADDTGLASAVGLTGHGPFVLDLVRHGPHAVVGGTTGSGKSELLLSWVLGMAAERSPSAVTFLFVDFKGGASFGPLVDLPHSVGLLTDLDESEAERALASLAAELRHRERELSARSLRSIDEAEVPPFPRLVVVVDEYAAVVDAFPALHGAFTDIAARGRSLGVHLVLCTQRPAGVVRDGILANCPMRISLRVTSPADSVALLGTDTAAQLPARPHGRALVSLAGEPAVLFQVARSDRRDAERIAARWAHSARPRAPWLPPLPHQLAPEVLAAAGALEPGPDLPFALADLPREQRQPVAAYRPREHGSLLVLGAGGSGRSGVLAALEAAPSTLEVERIPRDFAAAWDALGDVLDSGREAPTVVLLDDADILLGSCPEGYQDALVDLLARILREGPSRSTWLVLTARRASGAISPLAALCGSRLVLRMADRAEHALAGAESPFVANAVPGSASWQGNRVQVVLAEREPEPDRELRAVGIDVATARLAVVSTQPDAMIALLRASAPSRRVVLLAPAAFGAPSQAGQFDVSVGDAPAILVADPDAWQAQWGVFAALQRSGDVLFEGCSLAEYRSLTRSRELPPPFPRGERPAWLRTADGLVGRARLPIG